jgi:hypothetical protein
VAGHDHRICGLAVERTFDVSAEFGSVLGSRGRFVFRSV